MIGAENAVAFRYFGGLRGIYLRHEHRPWIFSRRGIYKTALIIGAETLSKVTDWTDKGEPCVLFGDGAGAAVLKAEKRESRDMLMGSDGTKGPILSCTSRILGNFLTGTEAGAGAHDHGRPGRYSGSQ